MNILFKKCIKIEHSYINTYCSITYTLRPFKMCIKKNISHESFIIETNRLAYYYLKTKLNMPT